MATADRHSLDGAVVSAVPPELALHPYGVFTTFVAVDGSVLGWQQHLDRLAHGVRELWGHTLDAPLIRDRVAAHLRPDDGPRSVRVTVYPAALTLASPAEARGCRALVSSGPTAFPFAPSSAFAVRTADHVRGIAELKSTAIVPQIRLRREAQLAGFDDVLLRDGDHVLEGATWSLVVWNDNEVVTPAGPVLPSSTVAQLARIAESLGRRFCERPCRFVELTGAELVLAANVHQPARAISRVDDRALSIDPDLLTTIATAYSELPRDPVLER